MDISCGDCGCRERINLTYNNLKIKVGKNPNEIEWSKYRYPSERINNETDTEKKEILELYNVWVELSSEINEYREAIKLFDEDKEKVIFIIKKIHPSIPCGGWGYLVSKEEFLNGKKEN